MPLSQVAFLTLKAPCNVHRKQLYFNSAHLWWLCVAKFGNREKIAEGGQIYLLFYFFQAETQTDTMPSCAGSLNANSKLGAAGAETVLHQFKLLFGMLTSNTRVCLAYCDCFF